MMLWILWNRFVHLTRLKQITIFHFQFPSAWACSCTTYLEILFGRLPQASTESRRRYADMALLGLGPMLKTGLSRLLHVSTLLF